METIEIKQDFMQSVPHFRQGEIWLCFFVFNLRVLLPGKIIRDDEGEETVELINYSAFLALATYWNGLNLTVNKTSNVIIFGAKINFFFRPH